MGVVVFEDRKMVGKWRWLYFVRWGWLLFGVGLGRFSFFYRAVSYPIIYSYFLDALSSTLASYDLNASLALTKSLASVTFGAIIIIIQNKHTHT
jgi:hypothetical protein